MVIFHSVFPVEENCLGEEVTASAGRARATGSPQGLGYPLGGKEVSPRRWYAVAIQELPIYSHMLMIRCRMVCAQSLGGPSVGSRTVLRGNVNLFVALDHNL